MIVLAAKGMARREMEHYTAYSASRAARIPQRLFAMAACIQRNWQAGGRLALAELAIGQVPGHWHALGGGKQVELQAPVAAVSMRRFPKRGPA